MAMYDDGKDPDFAETPVKKVGKSKGRKGNVPPKTYTVPDLINEGTYVSERSEKQSTSGGYSKGYRPKNTSQSPDGQNVKYQPPKNAGKSSISELPGQMTGPVPVPKKRK